MSVWSKQCAAHDLPHIRQIACVERVFHSGLLLLRKLHRFKHHFQHVDVHCLLSGGQVGDKCVLDELIVHGLRLLLLPLLRL